MPDRSEERRRTTRVAARGGTELGFGRSHAVRLVEISMTGALLRTSYGLPVGQHGELLAKLGDNTFAANVEIRRVVLQSGQGKLPGRYSVGVTFVSLDAENRRCLERFLRQPASL
jgi:c-di-GMP-binding flagellar brake protein YcgR